MLSTSRKTRAVTPRGKTAPCHVCGKKNRRKTRSRASILGLELERGGMVIELPRHALEARKGGADGDSELLRNSGQTEMNRSEQTRALLGRVSGVAVLLAAGLLAASLCFASPLDPTQSPNIFKPQSTPAHSIFHLSMLVLAITGAIFAVVFSLLVYSVA